MKTRRLLGVSMVVAAVGGLAVRADDLGTAFSYQGSLEKPAGTPVDGISCDFRFGLWDAAAGGNQQGASPQTTIGVAVAGGVFTVPDLDFGSGAINGAARWLEIEVKCPPDAGFTLLSPRVELTPAPHAVRAWQGVGPPNALEVDTTTSYVGVGTDSPVYPLHVSTVGPSDRAGYGLHSAASGVTHGVYGQSNSTAGIGVRGEAIAGTGITSGVYGRSASTSGRAVYGGATAGSGSNYGGFFESGSPDGTGVYGRGTAGSGQAEGGHFESFSTDGRGVYGEANASSGTNYGGYFISMSTSGRGVYGLATNNDGASFGVYGESVSTTGTGVYGYASNNSGGATYGGRFVSDGTFGRGVYGQATASTGATYGGHFVSDSTFGRGVYGQATASTGGAYGGHFVSDSTDGRGVYALATADTGETYGGLFSSFSTDGHGVYGEASAISGTTFGVYGKSNSTSGRGVYGHASASSGATFGVYGECESPTCFAGYFTGGKSYFERSVGIGVPFPDVDLHVATGSDASLSLGTGYLVLGSVSGANLVFDTNEIIARNNGAGADLFINYQSGNVAILRNSVSHPLHVGTDSSTGNGAHLTAGGTWTNGSSRDFKEGFEPIDKQAVLRKVVELPVTRWQYKGEAADVHHIGPVAQDFRAAFEVGHDERYITTIDADGVALAAIQGLHQLVQEKDCEIDELKARVESVELLEAKVTALQVLVVKLAAQQNGGER